MPGTFKGNSSHGFIAIALCLLMVLPGMADLAKAEWPSEPNSNWNITGTESYQDQTITIESGSIYIYGSLSLTDVKLVITSDDGNTHGIFVEDGGSLFVSGGSIEGESSAHPIKVVLRGKATLDSTAINYLWSPSD